MADISISKFRTTITRQGATPSTPGFAESEGQDPVNPNSGGVQYGVGAGLSLDPTNRIQLGNTSVGVIDFSSDSEFPNDIRIKATADGTEKLFGVEVYGTINPSIGALIYASHAEFGSDYQIISSIGTDNSYFEVQNNSGVTTMKIVDGASSKGLEYFDDYESNFTARSLVTKQYVDGAISGAGHNPVTIGSPANGLSITAGQVLSIGLASAGVTGALSGSDWSTFNGKLNLTSLLTGFTVGANTPIAEANSILEAFRNTQGQINARVSGTGAAGQVAFWNGAGAIGGSANFTYSSNSLLISSDATIPLTLSRNIIAGLGSNLVIRNTDNTNLGTEIGISFNHRDTGLLQINSGRIISALENRNAGAVTTSLRFYVSNNDSFPLEKVRITASGQLWVSTTSGTNTLDVNGTARIRSIANATGNFLTVSATGVVQQRTAAEVASDIGATNFWTLGVGGIFRNGSVAIGVSSYAANAGTLIIRDINSGSASQPILLVQNGAGTVNALSIAADDFRATFSNRVRVNSSVYGGDLEVRASSDSTANVILAAYSTTGTSLFDVRGTGVVACRASPRFYVNSPTGTNTVSAHFKGGANGTDFIFAIDNSSDTRVFNVLGNGDIGLSEGGDLILGTTTGTKIGTAATQKLSFWNATPIVQPTTAGASGTLVSNAGTTLTSTDTIDGYTLQQVVRALRNIGLLA